MNKILILPAMLVGSALVAQNIGNSPYAAFGVGDVKFDNTIDIGSMAGISTAYVNDFNNKFNFKNPAANTNLELTAFSIEMSSENNFFKSDYTANNSKKNSVFLSNISLAFPISSKMKFGLGYQPYSSKSYDVLHVNKQQSNDLINRFYGSGSINTFQAGLSYNFSKALAIGVRSNFYMGNISDIEEIKFSDSELINGFQFTNKIRSFNFTAGSIYQHKFNKDKALTIGATYTFGNIGQMYTTYRNSNYYYSSNTKIDEIILEESTVLNRNIIPQLASVGIGYGKDGKWFLSTQADYRKGGETQFFGKKQINKDSYRLAVGGWILPNYNNFRNYLARVIYRYGAYYEKANTMVTQGNNTFDVDKFAITGGVSLPFPSSNVNRMSGVDIGFEIGRRGTLKNNLIEQNFINFKIGLNFSDKWFQKRQYD